MPHRRRCNGRDDDLCPQSQSDPEHPDQHPSGGRGGHVPAAGRRHQRGSLLLGHAESRRPVRPVSNRLLDLRHRRLDRLGRRLSGAALARRDALGRHPGPHRRQDSGHRRHLGRADLGFGAADHHSLRPDPVPRVRRLGPARNHGRAHQPARHPGRQVEDHPADGGPGLPAVRPQLGRLGPAV
ncbi:hypothetical protein D3C75_981520 [compost metagenome]